jgi:hypothetical protein
MANAKVVATEATTTRKVSNAESELIAELVRVRAEVTALTNRKDELVAILNELFGKQETSSVYDLLVNRGRELARLKWKTRRDLDKKKLAEKFPEAFEACQKTLVYAEVVTLHN